MLKVVPWSRCLVKSSDTAPRLVSIPCTQWSALRKSVLGAGGEAVSQRISDLSDGRIVVNHYAGGERVGPLDVFTEVSSGNAQMYNSADYYWVGQHPGWGFFAAVPFGLIATEINGWIRHGGGNGRVRSNQGFFIVQQIGRASCRERV